MAEQVFIGVLSLHSCASCGIPFGITRELEEKRRQDHGRFYCPNGHHLVFPERTPVERERDEARRRADRFETQLADMRAALPIDHRAAVARAARWSDNRALLGAFWMGFRARECGKCAEACPYPTHRGGFRFAWFDGFGEVEP